MTETWPVLQNFLLAFAAGLLIGIERGWRFREAPEGSRIAGIRTFTLISLFGAAAATVSVFAGSWVLVAATAGMCLFALGFYLEGVRTHADKGATTEVAAVLTYFLGVFAVLGTPLLVAALTVMLLAILGLKAPVHRLLERLDQAEISAFFQLVFLSAIVLPFLPHRGFGPGGILNPFEIWLMVVLVQSIGFFGHFAIRLLGAKAGVLVMGFFGGMASTTALSVSLARLARGRGADADVLASGLSASCVILVLRALLLAGIINAGIVPALAPPLAAAALGFALGAVWFQRRARARHAKEGEERQAFLPPPSNLLSAFAFGAFLAAILALSYYVEQHLRGEGVVALAALTGLVDVDSITIGMAKLANPAEVSTWLPSILGIFAALLSSAVSKTAIAWWFGSRAFGLRAAGLFLAVSALGLAVFALAG
jgi:uncharacterized membrane protein (DUF4010 family)